MCLIDSVTLMWWGAPVCCDPMEQGIYHMVVGQFLVVVHFLPNLHMHPCTHAHTQPESSRICIEGAVCEEYYRVRELLYDQFAIL